jgi:glutathione synthase/RimK-type ligase-like ATP-grasp enzyme
VIAGEHDHFPPFGHKTFFFEEMVTNSQDLGIELLFFSPVYWQEGADNIQMWQYVAGQWQQTEASLPRLLYDRFTTHNPREKDARTRFLAYTQSSDFRYLNPWGLVNLLRDKVAFHHYLQAQGIPSLSAFPVESLSQDELDELSQGGKPFFLKPTFGSQGQGIYRLHPQAPGLQFDSGEVLPSRPQALQAWLALHHPGEAYFLQPACDYLPYEGRATDLRVLVQNEGEDRYQITGVAARLGKAQSIISNLGGGGTAIPWETFAVHCAGFYGKKADHIQEELAQLCLHTSQLLHEQYGSYAEVAFDILADKERGFLILEGNSRPARWVFTVVADHAKDPGLIQRYRSIRALSTRRPVSYAAKKFGGLEV